MKRTVIHTLLCIFQRSEINHSLSHSALPLCSSTVVCKKVDTSEKLKRRTVRKGDSLEDAIAAAKSEASAAFVNGSVFLEK